MRLEVGIQNIFCVCYSVFERSFSHLKKHDVEPTTFCGAVLHHNFFSYNQRFFILNVFSTYPLTTKNISLIFITSIYFKYTLIQLFFQFFFKVFKNHFS